MKIQNELYRKLYEYEYNGDGRRRIIHRRSKFKIKCRQSVNGKELELDTESGDETSRHKLTDREQMRLSWSQQRHDDAGNHVFHSWHRI